MKRLYRIPALIFGSVAVITGACNKDDGPEKECCQWTEVETYTYQGTTYTYTYVFKPCSNGTLEITYTYSDGTDTQTSVTTTDWDMTDYTWEDVKAVCESYNN